MTLRVQLVVERAWCRGPKQGVSKVALLKTHSFGDYRVYTWWHTWYTHDSVSGWTWIDVGVFAITTHMKPPVYLSFFCLWTQDTYFWHTARYICTRVTNCCFATREINTKITHEWAQKPFVTRIHTLIYFLHKITNPKMTIKMKIFTHHPRVSYCSVFILLVTSQSIADDITMTR